MRRFSFLASSRLPSGISDTCAAKNLASSSLTRGISSVDQTLILGSGSPDRTGGVLTRQRAKEVSSSSTGRRNCLAWLPIESWVARRAVTVTQKNKTELRRS